MDQETPLIVEPVGIPPQAGDHFPSSNLHSPRNDESPALRKVTWILVFLIGLLLLKFLVPRAAEELQYAVSRGQQRAEYEMASLSLMTRPLEELSRAYQSISKKAGPSVVHINVVERARSNTADEFMLLTRPKGQEFAGQGSGVIVDSTGYVVTNNHVVAGASEIRVSLSDGRMVSAEVIGVDIMTDIAVLQVDAANLIAAEWGDSDEAEVGALVWAIGSPFGLERSITSGILSAKNRSTRAGTPYQDFLQTDAPVNPGNSGGPLVDARGRVIGITTAIVGDAYQGIGFAVPSSIAKDVYERIKANGRVSRGWLGAKLDSVSRERAEQLGLAHADGALISDVLVNYGVPSPAYQAGIRIDDVVIRWNKTDIRSPQELIRMVARTEIDSTAEVVVMRHGKELNFSVRVGERPDRLN